MFAGVDEVTPILRHEDARHVYHLYVVEVEGRDGVLQDLQTYGVGAGVHYPVSLPLQPAYAHLRLSADDFPVARAKAGNILSLPIFPEMRAEQVERVAAVLKDAVCTTELSRAAGGRAP